MFLAVCLVANGVFVEKMDEFLMIDEHVGVFSSKLFLNALDHNKGINFPFNFSPSHS